MKLRILLLTVSLMGLTGATLALAAGVVAATTSRYPGTVRVLDETMDLRHLTGGTLTRQGTYLSDDEFALVRRWYTGRLSLAPASDAPMTSDCLWLNQAYLVPPVEHTVAVLLCDLRPGTRVVVREQVRLWR